MIYAWGLLSVQGVGSQPPMKGWKHAQYWPLPSESYKMEISEDEPHCACKSQLPITALQVKLHFCIKCLCVCVCREPQGVFLSFCLLHLWTCSFQLRGEKKKLTREQVVSVQGLSNSFFVLLSHKGSSDKGCRSERNLEEHAREVRHLEKGFSCHFHIWGAVRYFNFLTLSCLEDSLAE